ncbi:JAB domain-containing protein [Bowmanella pacifica]|uniref:DNA repair protein RadC n=1 Tax=Bowmanella pacifica TaxID=502051 RepID=A0A917YT71_9ALTE|nr:JAB domain-containing protein [Bowmanella pacifica]GGO65355.1 DNA repair protein RadC [Bowmanella pacifica]
MATLREIDVKYRFKEVDCGIVGQAMTTPINVAKAFDYLKHETKELFVVVNLTSQHEINCFEVVGLGTVDTCSLRVAEVLRSAILLNMPAVVLIHNHPSGNPIPSEADKRITKRIVEAAEVFDIKVLDHVVIGLDNHISIRERHPELF